MAYTEDRIVTIFPKEYRIHDDIKPEPSVSPSKEKEPVISQEKKVLSEQELLLNEYSYEGDFVDGIKHGVGRLCKPNGYYIYANWQYNKPVRNVVIYDANKNQHFKPNLNEIQSSFQMDFFFLINEELEDNKEIKFIQGMPPDKEDAYKTLIDTKGLRREPFQDPDFDISE